MSAIRGLSQIPADNAVATEALKTAESRTEDKSGFDAIMADVAMPAARSASNADASRTTKARSERSEQPAGHAKAPLRDRMAPPTADDPRLARRAASREPGDMQGDVRKAHPEAAPEVAPDEPNRSESSATPVLVEAAAVSPVATAPPRVAKGDHPTQEQIRAPRPLVRPPATGEPSPVLTRAGSLRFDPPPPASGTDDTTDVALRVVGAPPAYRFDPPPPATEAADTTDVALRVVGAPAARPAETASREKPPAAQKTTAAARVVTATLVETQTHLGVASPAGRRLQASPVADANTADAKNAGDRRDPAGRSAPVAARVEPVDAREKRHVAEAAGTEAGNSSSDGQNRTASAPIAANAFAATPTGASLSTALVDDLIAALKDAPVATAPIAPLAGMPPIAPVKTMTLRLDLPEHGRIDVRLAVKGSEVSLHLAADREETVRKLVRERDAVVASLRDAGYDADIRAIATQRAPESRDAGSTQHQPPSGPTGGAGSDQPGTNGSRNGSRQADGNDRDARAAQREPHATQSPQDRRTGGIYV